MARWRWSASWKLENRNRNGNIFPPLEWGPRVKWQPRGTPSWPLFTFDFAHWLAFPRRTAGSRPHDLPESTQGNHKLCIFIMHSKLKHCGARESRRSRIRRRKVKSGKVPPLRRCQLPKRTFPHLNTWTGCASITWRFLLHPLRDNALSEVHTERNERSFFNI